MKPEDATKRRGRRSVIERGVGGGGERGGGEKKARAGNDRRDPF